MKGRNSIPDQRRRLLRGQNRADSGKIFILYALLLPLTASLFIGLEVGAVSQFEGSDHLHYLSSNAFGDISRMVEADCTNGIDDDGDGLIDMDDIEDCGI